MLMQFQHNGINLLVIFRFRQFKNILMNHNDADPSKIG